MVALSVLVTALRSSLSRTTATGITATAGTAGGIIIGPSTRTSNNFFTAVQAFSVIPTTTYRNRHSNSHSNSRTTIASFHSSLSLSSSSSLLSRRTRLGTQLHAVPIRKASNNNNNNDNNKEEKPDFEPTWTYTSYKPPRTNQRSSRNFSTNTSTSSSTNSNIHRRNDEWIVPNKITIPEDKIEMSFVRSSGAGGQNVNKVNTQVMIKLHIMNANWIPHEVRIRITKNESNKINKEGYINLTSQEYRTQAQNRQHVLLKLSNIILKHYPRPKVRKFKKGVSKKQKEIRKQEKRWKSDVKKNRKKVDF